MSTMSGADADALDQVARELERSAQRMSATNARLARRIHTSPWDGRSADNFRQQWSSVHSRAIKDAAAFLDGAGDRLRHNATQQRDASTARGGRVPSTSRPVMAGADDGILPELLGLLGIPVLVAGSGVEGLDEILRRAGKRLVTVRGYTTRAGKQVSSYVRWARGEAGLWTRVVGDAKNVAKISKAIKRVGTGLVIVGAAIDGLVQWNKDGHLGTSERLTRAAAVSAGRGAVTLAAAKGGMAVGAVLGSFVPVVGTAIGAGIGAAVGGIGANLAMNWTDADRLVSGWASSAHDRVAPVVEDVASAGRDIARKGGGIISGGANLAKQGVAALWPG